ncbi:hypothetical protein [Neptuniibacter sp.]|uniref:hypothetical protein n=1 Tax=Neptuniibacter sp. TaxID=1962643 RepID=UPI003B5B01BF
MAMKRHELDEALDILNDFKKQKIHHSEFGWRYITDRVKPSKSTLDRNKEFMHLFAEVKKLVKIYAKKGKIFNHDDVKKSHEEVKIANLEREIEDLKAQLARERERLAYAQMVARQNGLDPTAFMENSPLNPGLVAKA